MVYSNSYFKTAHLVNPNVKYELFGVHYQETKQLVKLTNLTAFGL